MGDERLEHVLGKSLRATQGLVCDGQIIENETNEIVERIDARRDPVRTFIDVGDFAEDTPEEEAEQKEDAEDEELEEEAPLCLPERKKGESNLRFLMRVFRNGNMTREEKRKIIKFVQGANFPKK